MQLWLGNLNYSSWSIRAALVARASGLDIEERVLPLGYDETRAELIERTGHHKVPILFADGLIIPDSLSITEWIAEQVAPGRVWPQDAKQRALSRTVVAEMHSGFMSLRSQMPVNIRRRLDIPDMTPELTADIERVLTIWEACLNAPDRSDGPFLFGAWCAADAFYAPVVTRFRTYGYELDGAVADYANAVWTTPLMQTLQVEAQAEPWELEVGQLGPVRGYLRDDG